MDHENIYERRHSCKWYFDEAIAKYDAIVKGKHREGKDEKSLQQNLVDKILENGLTREYHGRTIPARLGYHDSKCNILNGSLFPLFLIRINEPNDAEAEEADEKREQSEIDSIFEKKKFEICKVLNAIDSIVDRICSNSMEASFTETDDGHFVSRETVLKWLFAENEFDHYTIQDRDRAEEYCKQAYLWLRKQARSDVARIDKAMELMKEIDFGGDLAEERNFITRMRISLGKTIEEIHDLYHSLSGFRKYAIRADLAKPEMKKEHSLNKLLALSEAILNFFLTVCSSYMRIDRLNLPRAQFADARLAYSNVSDSNFASSDFSSVTFYRANAKNCDFSMASLREIDGQESDFSGSLFSYADLSGANFDSAVLSNAKIDYANLGKKNSKALDTIITAAKPRLRDSSELDRYLSYIHAECDTARDGKFEDVLQSLYTQVRDTAKQEEECEDRLRFVLHDKGKAGFDSFKDLLKSIDRFGNATSVPGDIYDKIREALKKAGDEVFANIEIPSRTILLRNVTADNAAIPSADFSIVNFSGASFKGTQLPNLKASYADGSNSAFDGANLYNASLYSDNFTQSSFATANLGQAKLINCNFKAANFDRASLVNALFLGTNEPHFQENLLEGSIGYVDGIAEAEIYPIPRLKRATSEGARSVLGDCSMVEANASGALFVSTDFDRSSLIGASFRNAILYNCSAISTNWDNATATFSLHADCLYTKSSFRNGALYDSAFTNCEFSQCSFARAQMFDGLYKRCSFINSYLGGANLTHSVFKNCVFYRTIFTDAMFASAEFENCLFIEISMEAINGIRTAKFKDSMFINCTLNKKPLHIISGNKESTIELQSRKTLVAKTGNGVSAFSKYSDVE